MSNTSFKRKTIAVLLSITTVMTLSGFMVVPFVAEAAPHAEGCLINASGTYHLIQGGMRKGVTNPGILFSYGYEFKDAATANSDDLALPDGGTLKPGDGALVKKPGDPTVWLISGGQKWGFVSAAVFTGAGFNFANVLEVTANELDATPQASGLYNDATMRHPAGVYVNASGTIYHMAATERHGIPSLEVWNSYHKDNDFSDVVPANAADLAVATGAVWSARLICADAGAPTPGQLTYSLASDTPAGATVPKGATNVGLVKFNIFNGGSSAVTVDSIVVKRIGAGAAADWTNVYLFQGDNRLTTGRSINTTTHEASFTGANVSVPASGSVTLLVTGDVATGAGAGNTHQFEVLSVMSGSTVASASGLVRGNTMTLAAVSAGSATIDGTGSLTNPKVGQAGAKVAEFKIDAGSGEDIELRRLILFQGGNTSRANLTNFVLKQGGTQVATAAGIDSKDRMTFTFASGHVLPKGSSRTYELFVDIGAGAKANDTIRIYLEEKTDLFALGKNFGFGVTVTNTDYDNSANDGTDASWTTVEGGRITLNFAGPAATDVSPNAQDVELFRFTIASQNNVEVRKIQIKFDAGGTCAAASCLHDGTNPNYKDVKITDTGSNATVAGPKDLDTSSDTTQTLSFTDVWNVNAAQTRTLKVTADLANYTPASDETIKLTYVAFGGSDIKNLDSNTFVAATDIVPNSNIAGNTHNVKTTSLATALAGTPAAQTYVNGKQNAALVGLNFTAGIGRDVKITSIKVTATGAGSCATETNCVLSVRLMDGATQLGDSKNLAGAGSNVATFDSLQVNVARGTTKTLTVQGNLSTTASDGGTDDTFIVSVAAAADVTAQDPDGNTVNPTGTATGPTHTFAQQGAITVLNASTETDVTDSHIVVAGKTNVVLAKYRFTAQDEDIRLTQLGITIGATAKEEVLKIRLFDGATEIGTGAVPDSSGIAKFVAAAGSQLATVPKNQSKTLTVSADLNTIGGTGASSGTTIRADLTADGTATFEAIGAESGKTLTDPTNLTLNGTGTMTYRKTKPVIELRPLPTTVLTNGTVVLMRFRITADAAEQVTLKKFGFTISYTDKATATDLDVTAPAIREVGASSDIASTNFITADTASLSQNLTARIELTSEQGVAAGSFRDFELRATVADATETGDSVTSKLDVGSAGNDDAVLTGFLRDGSSTTLLTIDTDLGDVGDEKDSFFIWSDNAAIPHNDTIVTSGQIAGTAGSADWINAFQVKVLPSDTQSLNWPS